MQFDQRPRNGEAEPESAFATIDPAFSLYEQIEHTRHEVRRDANPAVAALDDHLVAVRERSQRDAAARLGVLRRVREEIRHDLGQADAIGVDDETRRDVDGELVTALGEDRRGHLDGARNDICDLDVLAA